MLKRRLLFTKTGRAKFLSHLDLMRTFQRAFLRADIRLRHSEGFNPHPVMSFALPLSVGTESVCELLDFQLGGDSEPDGLADRLGRALPEGLGVLEIYEPMRKFSEIKWLEVRGRLDYDGGEPGGAAGALRELFDRKELILTKKTKKGAADFDVIPNIRRVAFDKTGETEITLEAVLSAQDPSLNPKYLIEAIRAHGTGDMEPDFAAFGRVEVFDAEGRIFR